MSDCRLSIDFSATTASLKFSGYFHADIVGPTDLYLHQSAQVDRRAGYLSIALVFLRRRSARRVALVALVSKHRQGVCNLSCSLAVQSTLARTARPAPPNHEAESCHQSA